MTPSSADAILAQRLDHRVMVSVAASRQHPSCRVCNEDAIPRLVGAIFLEQNDE